MKKKEKKISVLFGSVLKFKSIATIRSSPDLAA